MGPQPKSEKSEDRAEPLRDELPPLPDSATGERIALELPPGREDNRPARGADITGRVPVNERLTDFPVFALLSMLRAAPDAGDRLIAADSIFSKAVLGEHRQAEGEEKKIWKDAVSELLNRVKGDEYPAVSYRAAAALGMQGQHSISVRWRKRGIPAKLLRSPEYLFYSSDLSIGQPYFNSPWVSS